MGAHRDHRTRDDDRAASLGAISAYAFGLGIATVIIPLLALDSGYDAAAVGLLVAIAAGSQFATRMFLPTLLGRFPDRGLIGLGSVGMVLSYCLLIASTALPVFVAAQIVQGASRAVVWTSSQTHAVRGSTKPVQRLVDLNVAGNAGSLAGPAVGGMLAVAGFSVALAVAAIASAVAVLASRWMRVLPPYDRRMSAGTVQLLRRDGVDVACWASAVGGGWWSMMGSYVPVLAVAAGIGSVGVGWLITLAEGAGIVALLILRRLPPVHVGAVVRGAAAIVVAALIGLALVALSGTTAMVWLFALLVIVGGASSGTITTLAPAMASLVARPEEQGDVMALTGMFRAGALLAAPVVVAITLTLAGIPAAVAIVAGGLGLPGLVVGRGDTTAAATVADEASRS